MGSIIVVFPRPEDAKRIRAQLMRGGYGVYAACTSGAAALQAADRLGEGIVVCAVRLPDMMYDRLMELLPGPFDMLVLSPRRRIEEGLIDERMMDGEITVPGTQGLVRTLALPAPLESIFAALDELETQRSFRSHPRGSRSTVRTEEEKQLLGRAKRELMERRGISEEEAHRYLQKASMESGTNVVETAQMILSLLG